jgi:hypothetical protein
MAEMGPLEYAANYWNMEIPIFDNENEIVAWEPVELKKYRQHTGWAASPVIFPPGQLDFLRAIDRYTYELFNQGKPLVIQVMNIWHRDVEVNISTLADWHQVRVRAVQAFSGNGSPEDVQLTLQLAARCGVAANGLQQYCDERVDGYSRLGLDFNGFVGNYLRYKNSATQWEIFSSPDLGDTEQAIIRDLITLLKVEPIYMLEDPREAITYPLN